jgi:uncharacterized protein YjiS (DUF1127 family)
MGKTMNRIRQLLADYMERRRYRRSLTPLAEASDRDLQDLGLSRQDIPYLRAGHRIDRPPRDQDGRTSC